MTKLEPNTPTSPVGSREPADEEIHLWLLFQPEAESHALLDMYRDLLSDEERQRAGRFHFEKHRNQYVMTRALIRTVLSRYSGLDPRDWRFATNEYGRPRVAAPNVLETVSFNLAHTDGLIVCACAKSAIVGVDAEQVRADRARTEIADRYFSAAEAAELRGVPMADRAMRFYSCWTLKESYIKALGTGLSTPLDQFTFTLADPGRIGLSFHQERVENTRDWRCWLLQPATGYLVAICAERATTRAQRIVARRVIPLVLEEPHLCKVIATTSD